MQANTNATIRMPQFICTECDGDIPSSPESRQGIPDLARMGLCLRCYVHEVYVSHGFVWDATASTWDIDGRTQY